MARTRTHRAVKGAQDRRGVALLIVVISIAILTAVATDFAYNSRVDLQLAANNRDEVRAYFLARSGIGLSRLVLKFQRQLDQMSGRAAGAMGGGALPGGLPGGLPGMGSMNLQIWPLVKVDCQMLQGMVPQEPAGRDTPPPVTGDSEFDKEFPELAAEQARLNFGGFEGCFNAVISDEEEKINLGALAGGGGPTAIPVINNLLALLTDKRFEFVFEKEDAHGVKENPQDMLIHIVDWMDENEVQNALSLASPTDPLPPGFSDEDAPYQRYEPEYSAKNARFDSLDELYMVHGVSDAFMAAFRDRLTVYPTSNAKLNVNTSDPMMLYMAILAVADPTRPDPRLGDPLFVDQIIKAIHTARAFSFLRGSVMDFINVVEAAGVRVNPRIRANVAQAPVSDKSTTYRIESVGEAGAVQKKVTAIVRLDDALGTLVYWREE